ncbi:hypothetical protein B6U74_06865 [Candidatus Bathyarchaeota archaeon ex4484_205]|nr:MAG: hypothetical protein B6U74_06865 [Candidatus Bathyarchaeota archaeon ex4484_205]
MISFSLLNGSSRPDAFFTLIKSSNYFFKWEYKKSSLKLEKKRITGHVLTFTEMKPVILVSGLLPYDSGKTFITTALGLTLKRRGLKVSVFKPISAHSLWYQYREFKRSLSRGVLFGRDVAIYMRMGLINEIDYGNPIDMLIGVRDPTRYKIIDKYLDEMSNTLENLLLLRTSIPGRRYFLVKKNVERLPNPLKREVLEGVKVFGNINEVSLEWTIRYLSSRVVEDIILRAFQKNWEKSDVILVESFSDALIPSIRLSKYVTKLIIVSPSRAYEYQGIKLRMFVENVRKTEFLTSSRFLSLFRAEYTLEVEPAITPVALQLEERLVEDIMGAAEECKQQ